MLRSIALLAALTACGSSKSSTSTPTNATDSAALAVGENGIGPLDKSTTVTVDAVKAAMPGYDVVSSDSGLGTPDVHVSRGDELQVIVAAGEGGTAMYMLAMSPKVSSSIGLRVGDKITDTAKFQSCECIADGLTCFAKGSHVGAVLDENCMKKMEEAAMAGKKIRHIYEPHYRGDAAALSTLAGRTVRMVKWSALAFDDPARMNTTDDPPPPPENEE